ncbi:mucin-5AC [Rhipicephalus sanguineus]|uniref:mucin-5AC n=1 Tax=Rhipicephalus sanguineus TaxID=34632 RepID=UPI0020C4345C|nr:mucin-5AC [Rhipicephalus sanguineus]
MRRWVSEYTTNTATRRGTTTAGNACTTDDSPNLARAPAPAGPAEDVSLGQLTYSIKSSQPSSAPDKEAQCERPEQRRAMTHRVCQSEGQLRPIPLLALPRQRVNATPAIPSLSDDHQHETRPQQALGALHQGHGREAVPNTTETTQWPATSASVFPYIASPSGPWHSYMRSPFVYYTTDSDSSSSADSSATTSSTSSSSMITSSASSSDTAPVLYVGASPQRTARGSAQGALAPKSTGVAAQCARRDVATATDTVPPESRWGDWVGGEKLLMVGATLLSILLIASAAATTASIVDRRSTAANGAGHRLHDGAAAGVAPTDPLLPGLIAFTESPGKGDFGAVAGKASAKASWKSTTNEIAEEADLTTEQPVARYGNASGDSVTAEDILAMPFRRPAKPECGAVFYTHCHKPRREFLYRASLNACLAAADDRPAQLCNRGTNRFSSWRDCETRCVLAEPPHEACVDKTLLLGCRRQDVHSSWWWFDGRVCLAWNFPAGGCPANGSAVFATANECTARCTNPRYPPCTAPRTVPCSSEQLKFPFFAAEAPSSAVQGRRHCFRLTRRVLESHRCLTGANRFLTKAACEQACKKPRSTRP